jgi:hypothetical protein
MRSLFRADNLLGFLPQNVAGQAVSKKLERDLEFAKTAHSGTERLRVDWHSETLPANGAAMVPTPLALHLANTSKAHAQLSDNRFVGLDLRDLLSRHPDWVMARRQQDAVHFLPEPAIAELAHSDSRGRALLESDQAAPEREFTAVCKNASAVGIL